MRRIFLWATVLALLAGLFVVQAPMAQADGDCVTLTLLDQSNNGVAGGKAQPAYGGSWGSELPGQTDSNGELYTCELMPDYTKIKMTINQSGQEQTLAQLLDSDYTWYTVPIVIELRDDQYNLITDSPGGGNVDQGGGMWIHHGYTGDALPYGQYTVQVFGGSTFRFRVGYNHTSQTKDQSIPTTGGTITFQTGKVTINCAGTVQLALGGSWYSYPSGTVLQLLPGTYNYKGSCGTGTITVAGGGQATVPIATNQPPVADAGPDQTVEQSSYAGAEVTLDGSGSSDPDGDALTYEWTWDSSSASGVSPTATFPLGLTTVTLTVSDGELSDADTVDINVVDTTPPVVSISSPEDGKTYLNTQGPIPVSYTATDICDPDLDINMKLNGEDFAGNEIDLCGLAAGEHTLVISATDDSNNTGSTSATFVVEPQSLKAFTIKHMLIQWGRPGRGPWSNKDMFTILGRVQLPEGYTAEDLEQSATLTIAIGDGLGSDAVVFNEWPLRRSGVIWRYKGSEQPPGDCMNITKMTIWWAPQGSKWAGWAGFHISGVLQLPEEIGVNTQPAEATVTIEMPAKTESGCGSLIAKNTVKFKVLESARLWLYNVWPNLPDFPCDPTGME